MKPIKALTVFATMTAFAGCQTATPSQLLPEPVARQFHVEYPEARVRSVERLRQDNGTVQFRIKFLNHYDQPLEAVFDETGHFVSGDRDFPAHPRL